jgi:hypothetical protein
VKNCGCIRGYRPEGSPESRCPMVKFCNLRYRTLPGSVVLLKEIPMVIEMKVVQSGITLRRNDIDYDC